MIQYPQYLTQLIVIMDNGLMIKLKSYFSYVFQEETKQNLNSLKLEVFYAKIIVIL